MKARNYLAFGAFLALFAGVTGSAFLVRADGVPDRPLTEVRYQRVFVFDVPEDQPATDGELEAYDACWSDPEDKAERLYCVEKGYVRLDGAPYSNDRLHQWACDTAKAYDQAKGGDKSRGCYEACLDLAVKAKIHLPIKGYPHMQAEQALFVSWEDHPYDMANACAVVLHGAEW